MRFQKYEKVRRDRLFKDIQSLANTSAFLLKRVLPEPDLVKEEIMEEAKRLSREGWRVSEESKYVVESRLAEQNRVLRKVFIHGRKGERTSGADLVVELCNEKIIWIQAKRMNPRGRFDFNRRQLLTLIKFCFKLRKEANRKCPSRIPHSCVNTLKSCPVFYELISYDSNLPARRIRRVRSDYFQACEISYILGGRKSVSSKEVRRQGLSRADFRNLFWKCHIGVPDIAQKRKRAILYNYSMLTNRLVILVEIV